MTDSTTANARVLWLSKGLGRGGAEQLLVDTARHLNHGRFDVEVAYCLSHKDALVPRLVDHGIGVHCLRQRSNRELGWVWRLHRLLAERQYDIVHTHMPVPAAAARLLARSNAKLVHTEHNVWHRYRAPTYWANALTYGRNDAVLAVSGAVASSVHQPALLRRAQWPTVEVLFHGIERDRMHHGQEARAKARAELGIDPRTLIIGTVANFTPKKDQRTLLDAIACLRSRRPDAILVMVGSGPLEKDLRRRAQDLRIAEHVVFLGSRSDVPEILPAFDVFTLSSLHEGLSIALVEAMASGLPCVATRVGGIPEALRDGVEGRLVPPGNAAALCDGLLDVVADPTRYAGFSAAALKRADAFDMGRSTRAIERAYETVLDRR